MKTSISPSSGKGGEKFSLYNSGKPQRYCWLVPDNCNKASAGSILTSICKTKKKNIPTTSVKNNKMRYAYTVRSELKGKVISNHLLYYLSKISCQSGEEPASNRRRRQEALSVLPFITKGFQTNMCPQHEHTA